MKIPNTYQIVPLKCVILLVILKIAVTQTYPGETNSLPISFKPLGGLEVVDENIESEIKFNPAAITKLKLHIIGTGINLTQSYSRYEENMDYTYPKGYISPYTLPEPYVLVQEKRVSSVQWPVDLYLPLLKKYYLGLGYTGSWYQSDEKVVKTITGKWDRDGINNQYIFNPEYTEIQPVIDDNTSNREMRYTAVLGYEWVGVGLGLGMVNSSTLNETVIGLFKHQSQSEFGVAGFYATFPQQYNYNRDKLTVLYRLRLPEPVITSRVSYIYGKGKVSLNEDKIENQIISGLGAKIRFVSKIILAIESSLDFTEIQSTKFQQTSKYSDTLTQQFIPTVKMVLATPLRRDNFIFWMGMDVRTGLVNEQVTLYNINIPVYTVKRKSSFTSLSINTGMRVNLLDFISLDYWLKTDSLNFWTHNLNVVTYF